MRGAGKAREHRWRGGKGPDSGHTTERSLAQGGPREGWAPGGTEGPCTVRGRGRGSEQRPRLSQACPAWPRPWPHSPGPDLLCSPPRVSPSGRRAASSALLFRSLAAGTRPRGRWTGGSRLGRPRPWCSLLPSVLPAVSCGRPVRTWTVAPQGTSKPGEGDASGWTRAEARAAGEPGLPSPPLPGGGSRIPQSREHAWLPPSFAEDGPAARGSWIMAPQVTGRQELPGPG